MKIARSRLLASTMLIGAATLAIASTAAAQVVATPQTPTVGPNSRSTGSTASADGSAAGSDASSAVSEVVVTGTRIRSPNLTSNSPLAVVNSQEVKFTGTTQVEQLLAQLPQFSPGQTQQQSNGSSGTATINLRNLGSTRTLVLVDGRRLQPGDPVTIAPDINNIPAALVDRVETISGGASAVYGSDAISGVVNFILKKNFEGVQVDTQYTFYNHQQGNTVAQNALTAFGLPKPSDVDGDGQTWDVSLLVGTNSPDDKGNVTFYATYRNLQPVTQDSRDYSACSLAATFNPGGGFACAGSSNSAYGRFDGVAGGVGGSYTNNPAAPGQFVPYTSSRSFNYGPYNYIQRADDRYNAGAFAHYKVNDKVEVYADLMFTDDRSEAQIAPSGLFRGSGPNGGATYQINCDNPLLSTQQASVLCGANAGKAGTFYTNTVGYRFLNLPRQDELRHTNYRIDVGARGDLGQGWNYDAYLQYGTTILAENYQNDVSISKVQNALLVTRDASGNPVCTVGGACVPLNIFQALSTGLTAAQIGYVVTPGFKEAQVTEQIASFNISGDLGQYGVKSPFASDGVGVALGTEYRREDLSYKTDAEFTSGDLSGQGGPSIGNQGQFDVYELFGEARVPLIQNKPFIHDLTFDGGYRYSYYSTVGETDTYKGELSYAPITDLRFRATYNRAVRAPNIVELFTPQAVGNGSFNDPCAKGDTGAPAQATLQQCLRTGLTAAQYAGLNQCPAGQCSVLSGGNTALRPEKADTYTAGLVYTPSYIRGFNFSIDYFDITVKNYISAGVSPALALSQCISSGNPFFCGLVKRDPQLGILFGQAGYVVGTNLNTGLLRTRGIDLTANYTIRTADIGFRDYHPLPDVGSFVFSYIGTYTDELTTKPLPGMPSYNCRGLYGPTCGQPQPAYKSQFRAIWNTPWDVALTARWRYISGSKLDAIQANPQLNQGITATDVPEDAKIGAYGYLDLAMTWQIKKNLQFRAGVNNVTDRDPPVLDSNNIPVSNPAVFGNANTFPGVYDSLGRTVFLGLTANF